MGYYTLLCGKIFFNDPKKRDLIDFEKFRGSWFHDDRGFWWPNNYDCKGDDRDELIEIVQECNKQGVLVTGTMVWFGEDHINDNGVYVVKNGILKTYQAHYLEVKTGEELDQKEANNIGGNVRSMNWDYQLFLDNYAI